MIELTAGGHSVPITAIEYRPVDGLVVRVDGDVDGSTVSALGESLTAVLRGSAWRLHRPCCDSLPLEGKNHIGGCKKGQHK